MALLPDAERVAGWTWALRFGLARLLISTGLTKAEWRTMGDAADAWLDANAASYNSAIPAAIRVKATLAEKALALSVMAARRAGTRFPGED